MEKYHGDESRAKGEIVSGSSSLDSLPEECISNIISFTSTRDACVAASVSKTFKSAVNSDIIWEKFLPPDYPSLIPSSRIFSTKKELYFALCNDSVLIEDGKMSDKPSGKRCIMLSAKQLDISSGNDPLYWQWISIPESRFDKTAELLKVCWFEIRAEMHTRYLLLALVTRETERRKYVTKPKERVDGWMEAELGEFFNESCCRNISVRIIETRSPDWKRGLIIQGIEFRPAKA
ncbi:hypothetical protein EUTSA_v10004855mg [Eutrema salsugineum]|uniref:F-box domain-containing protein n=1 Tax=Eutrema salsugineum TaxID=72664 RepID=V4L052_EUTSA|nr:hypothetical protein EUTSA_v10004855mg [Eutrema salsugineum]